MVAPSESVTNRSSSPRMLASSSSAAIRNARAAGGAYTSSSAARVRQSSGRHRAATAVPDLRCERKSTCQGVRPHRAASPDAETGGLQGTDSNETPGSRAGRPIYVRTWCRSPPSPRSPRRPRPSVLLSAVSHPDSGRSSGGARVCPGAGEEEREPRTSRSSGTSSSCRLCQAPRRCSAPSSGAAAPGHAAAAPSRFRSPSATPLWVGRRKCILSVRHPG